MSRALIRVLTHTHTHTGYSHTIRESVYAITFLDTFNLGARVRIHPRAFASLAREGERRVARKKEFPRGPNRYRRALISLSLSLSSRSPLKTLPLPLRCRGGGGAARCAASKRSAAIIPLLPDERERELRGWSSGLARIRVCVQYVQHGGGYTLSCKRERERENGIVERKVVCENDGEGTRTTLLLLRKSMAAVARALSICVIREGVVVVFFFFSSGNWKLFFRVVGNLI